MALGGPGHPSRRLRAVSGVPLFGTLPAIADAVSRWAVGRHPGVGFERNYLLCNKRPRFMLEIE